MVAVKEHAMAKSRRYWQRWWITINRYLMAEIGKSLEELSHVPYKMLEKMPPRRAATVVVNLAAAGVVTLRPKRRNPIGKDPPLSTRAKLVIENHPNPDFEDEPCSRLPMATHRFQGKIDELIRLAVHEHNIRLTGRTLIAEIILKDGSRYHISQNGRVWAGNARKWTAQTREAMEYSEAGRKAHKDWRIARMSNPCRKPTTKTK
jgi:hypothetical protein